MIMLKFVYGYTMYVNLKKKSVENEYKKTLMQSINTPGNLSVMHYLAAYRS